MKAADDVRWVLLPGNHDPARADGRWSCLARKAPGNLVMCLEPRPRALTGPHVSRLVPYASLAPGAHTGRALAVLTRIAFADLLIEKRKPASLILDDALDARRIVVG